MKKLFILITVIFAAQVCASAQNGYFDCYGNFIPSSAPWLQATPQSFINGVMASGYYPAGPAAPATSYQQSSPSSSSSSNSSYESRYGDVQCHICKGTGVCPTCNGKGWFNGFYGDPIKCPNCHSSHRGKCGRCGGKGTVYGLK